MDRYDWEWRQRYGGPGGGPYDRFRGFGGDWQGRSYHRGPWGGPRAGRGRGRGYGGYDSHGPYDRYPRRWDAEDGPGYRYSYGGPGFGGGGARGRMDPWEAGPPGGYGLQWGTAYGERPRGGYDAFRHRPGGYAREFDRFDPAGGESYAELPPGYFDDYDPELDAAAVDDIAAMQQGWDDLPDDGEVRDAVARSLREDGFIDADAIEVEVTDRVVTLRGEVKDYMEARYAWDDTWDAAGVRGVISKLTVSGKSEE